MEKVEVFILAGFLGSGKTTLLKNLLQQEKDNKRKVAVVMNELGETSIDSNAVGADVPLKELLNGCVCCTIQGQLEIHLQGLLSEQTLDAIYVETTGVAHPIEVLDACMSPLFAEKLDVQSIITIVDALRWKNKHTFSIRLQKLLQEQVRHADVILLNKIDELPEMEQGSITFEMQSINSMAKCILTKYANVKLSDLRTHSSKMIDEYTAVHVDNDLRVKSYVYTFSTSIDIDLFEDWLRVMPDNIYRMKGYLRFLHSNKTFLFQYSYGMPIYLKEPLKYKTSLVFIGEDLNPTWIKNEMESIEKNSQNSN